VNVVGLLRGAERPLADEVIVVGAHYDHLGAGDHSSRDATSTTQIHNGADDNASGTAMVIEMAHAAARQRARFKRSVVFVAFAGEELNLLGSRHYVRHAPISIRRTVAMINLDMVGRARGRVLIGGTGAQGAFQKILEEVRAFTTLRLDDFREGYGAGASDNDPFEREKVPTLLFFTGFHDDYHRPSDDWERIDAAGASEIAGLALAMTARLAGAER
ncbi:MAG: M20/M25/M40 family metallo-hydrolase, partial [Vicinamibacterales bacterium]